MTVPFLPFSSVLSHGTRDFRPLVHAQVDPTAIIATDELPAYLAIGRQQAGHIKVNHSAGEFVRIDMSQLDPRQPRLWSDSVAIEPIRPPARRQRRGVAA